MLKSEVPRAVREEGGALPPLGLLYLQASLKIGGYRCVLRDLGQANPTDVELKSLVAQESPDVVGISAVTHKLVDVLRVARIAKAWNPAVHVCIGGPHTGIFPHETLQLESVDSIVIGEGEIAFQLLLEQLCTADVNRPIPGVYLKQSYESRQLEAGPGISDLDTIPFPQHNQSELPTYYEVMGGTELFTTMITSRGCPFQCSFCSTPKEQCRMRSVTNVIEELAECVAVGFRSFYFVDDTFNLDEQRVLELCEGIIDHQFNIRWSCRARVDRVSQRSLTAMKRAGCDRIQLGVETGTQVGLNILNKGITLTQVQNVFAWVRKSGIASVAYFMIGLPNERTAAEIEKTLAFAISLDPDFAMFNVFTPYPGTALYNEALARGIIPDDYWKQYAFNPEPDFKPPVWSESMTREDMYRILDKIYRRFYWRPKMLWRTLTRIEGLPDLKRKLGAGWKVLRS